LLGIELLDHIVLGDGEYESLLKKKWGEEIV
jgi:DNA repair protein RadC